MNIELAQWPTADDLDFYDDQPTNVIPTPIYGMLIVRQAAQATPTIEVGTLIFDTLVAERNLDS